MAPWLTTDEINDACSPLTQKAAQRRYLRSLGLKVERKPDGTALVLRSNVEQVFGSSPLPPAGSAMAKPAPDRNALVLMFAKKTG